MTNNDNTITLPEITIEGSPDSQPKNENDWWCEGFSKGFNNPETMPDRPLMINDKLTDCYFSGVASGQKTRKELETEFDERYRDSSLVLSDSNGEAYDEIQRRYNEEWEAVFHEHMPHTEIEGEPGPTFVRPNITIIPE